jgi:amino-acid N-acetyltransferase
MLHNGLPIPLEKSNFHEKAKIKNISPGRDADVVVMKPGMSDIEEILELINDYASANLMLDRGPQYLYENMRDFIIAVDRSVPLRLDEYGEPLYMIIACGGVHVLWKDIAEIRSLATHMDYQHMGYGRQIVQHLITDARKLGVKYLYTFTLTESFFQGLGFKIIQRNELPPKVWGECSRCPKYFRCDEVGMVLELDNPQRAVNKTPP